MACTEQRRTYLPLYLPDCSRYLFTDPERMEGWVSPGPGCKEQLAHDCYEMARGQHDSNPWPRGRWSNTLTTRLPRHPVWLCVWYEVHICIWPTSCHFHSLYLAPVNPDWYVYIPGFTFLVPAHLGSPRQNPEGRKTVVVVPMETVLVELNNSIKLEFWNFNS